MQLSLFTPSCKGVVPSFIQTVLDANATLAVSVSGGKDSDAMLRHLASKHRSEQWSNEMFALFCDLGRIEWLGVEDHLRKVCTELAVPLHKLYPNRSMIDEWQHRKETILSKQQDKPFWSSASARYCTKYEKTQPADKMLRGYDFVVCAVGLRAEESSARARKPRYQVRNDIASVWYKTPATHRTADEKEQWAEQAYHNWSKAGKKGRFALSWHPIHHWSLEDVWQTNGTSCKDVARRVRLYKSGSIEEAISDFPCHWAYVASNTRLSCALCVLGSHHDILNGAHHNPWTWAELALMEVTSGWSFQQGQWLASLSREVLSSSLVERQQLFKTLRHLGVVRPVGSLFLLSLMCSCELAQLLFWTDKAVLAITRLVSQDLPAS